MGVGIDRGCRIERGLVGLDFLLVLVVLVGRCLFRFRLEGLLDT